MEAKEGDRLTVIESFTAKPLWGSPIPVEVGDVLLVKFMYSGGDINAQRIRDNKFIVVDKIHVNKVTMGEIYKVPI